MQFYCISHKAYIQLNRGNICGEAWCINVAECVFLWRSQAPQSALGGWISGLAVVFKTCFDSPPGPVWIKWERGTGDVYAKRRKRMIKNRETDRRKHTDALHPLPHRPKRLGFSVLIVSGGRLLAECTVSRLVPRLLLASWHLISTSHPHLYFSYSSVFPLLSPSLPSPLSLSPSLFPPLPLT